MTQSSEYQIEVEFLPEGQAKQPTAVMNLEINGRDYIMDFVTYNENIEAGKTKFVQIGDDIKMVTPEEYDLLLNALERFNEWKKNNK